MCLNKSRQMSSGVFQQVGSQEICFINIWEYVLGNVDRKDLQNDLIQRCVDLLGGLRHPFRYALVKKSLFFILCLVFCALVGRSKNPARGWGIRQLEL